MKAEDAGLFILHPSAFILSIKVFPASAVAKAEVDDPLQHLFKADASQVGRFGEILAVGDVRVWVGFQEVNPAIFLQAEVEPRNRLD